MRRLVITDRRAVRLFGLCAGLAVLLLINTFWRPQAHLPEIAVHNDAPAGSPPTDAQAAGDTPADTADPKVAAVLEAQALPQRHVKPLPAYGVTLQRPLFQTTRRPVPVAPKVAKPRKPPKPKAPPRSNLNSVRLTGIIVTTDKAFGLLSIPGQSELMRARVGQVVKGWKVKTVEKEALVLNNGEQDFRMTLWKEKPGLVTLSRQGAPMAGRPGRMGGGRK